MFCLTIVARMANATVVISTINTLCWFWTRIWLTEVNFYLTSTAIITRTTVTSVTCHQIFTCTAINTGTWITLVVFEFTMVTSIPLKAVVRVIRHKNYIIYFEHLCDFIDIKESAYINNIYMYQTLLYY